MRGRFKMSNAETSPPPSFRAAVSIQWVSELTGWAPHKLRRMCRQGLIPGAYQSQPGVQGSQWTFRRALVQDWFAQIAGEN